jgi:hypothetical protein
MKKFILLLSAALVGVLGIVVVSMFLNREAVTVNAPTSRETEQSPIIGGNRDENGCLGPAGYTYDEKVGACTRNWELDEEQNRAATVVINYIKPGYGTTIVSVEPAPCQGCFDVRIEKYKEGESDFINITLDNWEVVEKVPTNVEGVI